MAKRLEFNDDTGIITIRIGAETYTVEPPTIGVMRELDLLAASIDREGRADTEQQAAEQAPDEVDAETVAALTDRPLSELVLEPLPWWRLLFERCADKSLPADDDCPLWFGATVILARVQTFWTLHPFLALGSNAPPNQTENP